MTKMRLEKRLHPQMWVRSSVKPKWCVSLLEARREEAAEREARYRALTRGRRFALGLVVAVIWLADKERFPVKLALAVGPAVLLEGLMLWRSRAAKAWRRATQAAEFYEQRL